MALSSMSVPLLPITLIVATHSGASSWLFSCTGLNGVLKLPSNSGSMIWSVSCLTSLAESTSRFSPFFSCSMQYGKNSVRTWLRSFSSCLSSTSSWKSGDADDDVGGRVVALLAPVVRLLRGEGRERQATVDGHGLRVLGTHVGHPFSGWLLRWLDLARTSRNFFRELTNRCPGGGRSHQGSGAQQTTYWLLPTSSGRTLAASCPTHSARNVGRLTRLTSSTWSMRP